MLLTSVGGAVYLVRGIHRFSAIQRLGEKHRLMSWIVSVLLLSLSGLCCFINYWTMIVVLIHLFVFWFIADIAGAVIRKTSGRKRTKNYTGAFALAFTALYLGEGWYFAHHVYIKEYSFTTAKPLKDDIRAVLIADSHMGITLDGEDFAEQMQRIKELDPDIVLIAGDFVDDDSRRIDAMRACEALGEISPGYGTYFIYGNHDKGYYESYRDFTYQELAAALEENGVTILEDESVLVNDDFYVIGRQDKSEEQKGGSRASMEELTRDLDSSKYTLVLDHQPNSYDEEAACGADLVLSGHTHGGHLFPAGYIGLLMGANDKVYGSERRGNTDFLVTSGISGWAIPFKTGAVSEIVVINITSE